MVAARGPGRQRNKALPVIYLVLTLGLIVAVLPTALRPPPDEATASAEFSPDVPPEDDPPEQIISSFGSAESATAGATDAPPGSPDGEVGEVPIGPMPSREAPPSACPFGFGNPPRQTESLYSAPCAPAFTGDNGGATHRGVTATEVRIAIAHPTGGQQTSYEGEIPRTRQPNENGRDRTYRVLRDYFERSYQLYNRKLRVFALKPESGSAARASAETADSVHKVFGAITFNGSLADELAYRGIVSYVDQLPGPFYQQREPYQYSWFMDTTRQMRLAAEYVCKKLAGKPAAFAGDPNMQSDTRKFGLFYYADATYGRNGDDLERFLRDQCGVELATKIGYDLEDENLGATLATAIARMNNAGVTTVILAADWLTLGGFTNSATANGYFPEWFFTSMQEVDTAKRGRTFSPPQWENAFGLTALEMPRRAEDDECRRAYKSVEPDTEPDADVCSWLYPSLLQMMNGIQAAGPNLNPQTFRRGLFSLGRRPSDPLWSIGGGYGPGDLTYADVVAEIWWDATATDPNGDLGAYRFVRCGKRYDVGQLPSEDPLVFTDGETVPC